MCENSSSLVFFLILKLLGILIIPIVLLFYKKMDKKYSIALFSLDVIILSMMIILRLFNNNCAVYSNIKTLKIINAKNKAELLIKTKDKGISNIITNDIYKTSDNSNVYYFNNVDFPLSNQSISCATDTVYMKDYGNEITAISIMVSSVLDKNIDPIEILDLAKKNNIIDCKNRIDIDGLMSVVNNTYNLYSTNIDSTSAYNKIKNGEVILAEVNYKEDMENITCDKDYVVIYKINNDNKYVLLNPSKRDNDYICPDNTKGFLSVIKSKDTSYSVDDINKICSRYIYMGRN